MYITQPYTWKGISIPNATLKITGISLDPDSYDRTLTINRYTDNTFAYDIEQFQVVITTDHTEAEEYYTELLASLNDETASIVS